MAVHASASGSSTVRQSGDGHTRLRDADMAAARVFHTTAVRSAALSTFSFATPAAAKALKVRGLPHQSPPDEGDEGDEREDGEDGEEGEEGAGQPIQLGVARGRSCSASELSDCNQCPPQSRQSLCAPLQATTASPGEVSLAHMMQQSES